MGDSDRTLEPMSCLVDAVSAHDRKLLDDLEKAIEKKKRELRKKGAR